VAWSNGRCPILSFRSARRGASAPLLFNSRIVNFKAVCGTFRFADQNGQCKAVLSKPLRSSAACHLFNVPQRRALRCRKLREFGTMLDHVSVLSASCEPHNGTGAQPRAARESPLQSPKTIRAARRSAAFCLAASREVVHTFHESFVGKGR